MTAQIILRSCRDGRYIAGADSWTESPDRALNFEKAASADLFVRDHNLPDMELIIHRENASTIRIPMRIAPGSQSHSPPE